MNGVKERTMGRRFKNVSVNQKAEQIKLLKDEIKDWRLMERVE